MRVTVLGFIFFIATQGHCENILYLHGVISPSHHIWNNAVARSLAIRGHNVTFLSTDPPKNKVENLHYVVLEKSHEILDDLIADEHENFDMLHYVLEFNKNKFKSAGGLVDYAIKSCKAILQTSEGINQILSYPNDFKFDLVIYDFTCGPCILPIVHKFKYPAIVGVSPFLNPPYTDLIIGGHKYPSYVPHYILNFSDGMTLFDRIYNLIITYIEKM